MFKTMVACAALSLASFGACAADMSVRASAQPAPASAWGGLYIGAQAAAVWVKSDIDMSMGGNAFGSVPDLKPTGVLGGVHVGHNWLLPSRFLIGVEGDIEGGSIRDDEFFQIYSSPVPGTNVEATLRWEGSLRGRIGYALPQMLFYMTGGVAFADQRLDLRTVVNGSNLISYSHLRTGWTVGGGVEYAFTGNWTGRVEYRYSDYIETEKSPYSGISAIVKPVLSMQAVRLGLSYNFGGATPVVARH